MRNKHYIIALSIAVAFALIVVIWTFNCVNISEDRRWVDLAQTFLYPLSCTVIGSAILTYAGLEISDKVLENYNKRIGYGLSNRQIYFQGSANKISETKEDLQVSNLIKSENYMDSTITAYDADIAILCIEGEPTKKSKQDSNNPNQKSDPKKMSKWQMKAHDQVTALKATLTPQQALIVYTDGWLHDDTKAEINNRPFSVLVNFRGRIVTDIHSLLTTLPPRNGD
ncbi:hypothetical protein [uncultured Actinomyces sp.]|jgi:hypothetical protein|uniref:hypothetical protein n=1 Tax=uncultured Actinomyces sp. TaxID=249061 RepID=UPI002636CAB1|nr:hypothetical protein [uncultured Actinomyces sp.]